MRSQDDQARSTPWLRLTLLGLAVAALLTAAGCITKPQIRAVNKVKKVAIIGFSVVQPTTKRVRGLHHTFESAAKFYRLVEQQLATARGWQVTPLERVQNQRLYSNLAQSYSAHLLSSDIRPSNILSQEEQVNLSPKHREKLRKALGVDGVISIGFALTRPTQQFGRAQAAEIAAKVSFDLYAGKGSKSIWQVSSLPSKPMPPPKLPDDLGLATGDEMTVASAIAAALTTMMDLRRQEEAAAAKK